MELVIRENGGVSRPTSASAAGEPSSSTSPSPSNAAGSRRDPIERQRSFPKSYIESTHRREWFENHEKADEGDDDTTEEGVNNATTANPGSTATSPNAEDLVRDFVVVPPINEGPAQVRKHVTTFKGKRFLSYEIFSARHYGTISRGSHSRWCHRPRFSHSHVVFHNKFFEAGYAYDCQRIPRSV